jgi:CDP-glycerol glycerophosphotransferase (TagB/SpsB family)
MKIMIQNLRLEQEWVELTFSEIEESKKENLILKDFKTGNELAEKIWISPDTVQFKLKANVESLGRFEVVLKENENFQKIPVSDTVYENLRLSSYCYDLEKDFYMRYMKNEEGQLCIAIHRARKLGKRETVEVKELECRGETAKLYLEQDILKDTDDYRFFIVPANREGMWIMPISYKEQKLEVDFKAFVDMIEKEELNQTKWRMYLEAVKDGTYHNYRLHCGHIIEKIQQDETDYFDHREMYHRPLKVYAQNGFTWDIHLYITQKGYIAVRRVRERNRYIGAILNRVLDISIHRGRLKMEIEAHDFPELKIKAICLEMRSKKKDEYEYQEFPVKVKMEKGHPLVFCDINLKKVPIRPLYWDVKLIYESRENGDVFDTRITNHSPKFEKKNLMSFFSKNTYQLKTGEIFYPYMTVTERIAFQCREKGEYDGYLFKIKERMAALIYFLFKPFWIQKNIYLVYEKFCVMAQDNGYYFFQYCMENDMEKKLNRRIYYIMDRNSPDWDKLQKYKKRVIPFMSLKHIVYLLASKLLISTDTRDHVYAWRTKDSILAQYLDSKKLVFLQHGVIALKQVHFLYSNTKRGRCNIFITSNDTERDIIYNFFGYKKKQIAVTGLARWDVLEDHSEGKREILVMPTWRNWLDEVSDETFIRSDYYQNYMAFLNSDRLSSLLEKYDLQLNFYLHPKFREYIGDFEIKGNRLRLIPFGEEPLNELMMRCKLLITDYSSVCWDVFYQGKPVIFYQFDTEQYNEAHGSYIDLETDLFGDRVEKQEELFAVMEEYIQNGFTLKEKYQKMRPDCYKYIDKNNSQRICEEIIKRGW